MSALRRRLINNSLYNIGGYAYLLLASFLSIPWLARGLGVTRFAQYLLLAAVPPVVSILDFGVSQAVVYYLAKPDTSAIDKLRIRQNSLLFYLVSCLWVAALAALVLYGTSRTLLFTSAPVSFAAYAWIVGSAVVNQLLTHYLALSQGEHRFDIFNLKTVVVGTGNTLVPGILALHGSSLAIIFFSLFLSYVCSLVFVLFAQRFRFRDSPRYDAAAFKALLRFGIKAFTGALSGQVETQAGKYVLAGSLAGGAVAAFAIPQAIVYKAAGAVSQSVLALYPVASSLSDAAHRQKLRAIYHRVQLGLLLLGIAGVALAYLYGGPFLLWWLKDQGLASSALPVLRVMSIFFVSMVMTPVASMIMDGLGYPGLTSTFAVTTAVMNLVLLFLLTPRFGAVGAAYAILISSWANMPAFLYLVEKKLKA